MFEEILSSKSKLLLLKLFYKDPERNYTFKELSKLTGLSYGTTHPALSALTKTRIITTEKAGRSILYKINTNHPLFGALEQVFVGEKEAFLRIARETVRAVGKEGIKTIVLFGSVARGDISLKSDIDLLILYSGPRKKTEQKVGEALRKMRERYDAVIIPTYLSIKEAKARRKQLDRFILSVLEEGRVLYGDLKWLEK